MQCSRKGFTLIELMIVIVLFCILAAIVIPTAIANRDHAREAVVKDNANKLQYAVEDWATGHDGEYPSPPEAAALIDSLTNTGYFHPNPYGGTASFGIFGWMLPEAGMVMYFAPDSTRVYSIDGHGKHGVCFMTLSNG